ncbi:hypothetical protein NLG97_g9439 [Lecanicillium saksenae]|uniref:Uncharacterized protein n=1 Tax=Lecanicillium saksenae TaxID=468837 RepID=A0ACC1QHV2_9HYPO|nr:hypothetical protein NLG97_g9439 [Lecanicillium saksenae]
MAILDEIESLLLANFPRHSTVEDGLAEQGVPSTSIAVLDNGVLSTRCYSTLGDTTSTAFQACSISKAINAFATMRLVDAGRLTLAGTLAELLPKEFLDLLADGSPENQRPLIESITVKQLLSHTSGISPSGFPGYSSTCSVPSLQQIVAGTKPANTVRFRMTSPPGSRYSYSGAGATLLQIILENVMGQSYPDLMHDLVLEPLGMTRSFYGPLAKSEGKDVAHPYSNGHAECEEGHHHLPELAAAGLWSTPTDLLNVVRDVQKSLNGDGGLLRRETAKEMITEVRGHMALGWETINDDKVVFGHSGSNHPGYRCILVGFAKRGDKQVPPYSGIAIMTNSTPGLRVWLQLLHAISALKGWPFPSYPDMVPSLGRPATESGNDWKEWKGAWTGHDAEEGERHWCVLRESGDGLPEVVYQGLGAIHLLPAVDSRRRETTSGNGNGGFLDFIFEGMAVMLVRLVEGSDGARALKLAVMGGKCVELQRE